ncbi:hypothetical protein KKH39_05270 [Patescibacteria group bacterium]|nr:hypothetical protein [Patescibacteria group bacterium]
MDKIRKALERFTGSQKKIIKKILLQIESRNYSDLDIKKLKGYDNIFRVRKGQIRIIFQIKDDNIKIITIEKRSDTTYKL